MNLLNLSPPESFRLIEELVKKTGHEPYRCGQVAAWLWKTPAPSWKDATNLPPDLRTHLEEHFPITRPTLQSRQISKDGTEKSLWGFGETGSVESVMIPESKRKTLCISSQVGCAFGCEFCATGKMGFGRNLDAWEITAQIRELMLDTPDSKPGNIVFMGMGEPLHNWESVDRALTILNHPDGLAIGARHITVSSVGLIPGLEKLAARKEQFNLAISLHAATSEKRRRIMPVERKYPIPVLMKCLRQFERRVTFEYVMIAGLNDTPEDAKGLAELAATIRAHVNLLPLHPGGQSKYRPSPGATIRAFARDIESRGINVTVRRSRGLDISAACGQLRIELGNQKGLIPKTH